MSPTLSFSSALLALLDSAVSLTSLSFSLTANVPAFASSDVSSPVIRWVFAFSDFISVFFSVAGAAGVAGVAGVAGFACAKPRALKLNVVKATTKILIMFFTVSPPSFVLDVIFPKLLQIFTKTIKSHAATLTWNSLGGDVSGLYRPVSTAQSQPGHLRAERRESRRVRQSAPNPELLPQEIVEDLEAALEQFREIRGPGRWKKLNPKRVDLCE